MNIPSNNPYDDSTRTESGKQSQRKTLFKPTSFFLLLMTVLFTSGFTFSNLLSNTAAHAAPLTGTSTPDLSISIAHSITSPVTLPLLGVSNTWTVSVTNVGPGPLLNNVGTSPNFIQVNVQLPAGLGAGILTSIVAPSWSCTFSPISLIGLSLTCNYTGSFPIPAASTLPTIQFTGLLSALSPVVTTVHAQVVTMYDPNPGNNNTSDTISIIGGLTGNVLPSLMLNKATSGTTFTVGQPVTYTLTPTFNGILPNVITGTLPLTIDDYLPPGLPGPFTIGNPDIAGFWTCTTLTDTPVVGVTDEQCTHTFLTLADLLSLLPLTGPATLPKVTITGTFSAAATTGDYSPDYVNTSNIALSALGITLAAAETSARVQVFGAAAGSNIVPSVTVSDNAPTVGQPVTFTVNACNTGSGALSAGSTVTVTYTVPSGLQITAINTGGVWTVTPATTPINAGTTITATTTLGAPLAAGACIATPFTLTATTLATGPINNTFSATATGQATPNTVTIPITVQSLAPTASIFPSVTVSNTTPTVGQPVTFTINACNLGGTALAAGTPITITYTVPTGLQVTAINTGGIWTITPATTPINAGTTITATTTLGTALAAGNCVAVPFTLTATTLATGTINNTFTATVNGISNSTTLSISVGVAPPPPAPNVFPVVETEGSDPVVGQLITFEVHACNRGTVATTGPTTITYTVPANFTLKSANGHGFWTFTSLTSNPVIFTYAPSLAAGACTHDFTVTGTPTKVGTQVHTFTANTPGNANPAGNTVSVTLVIKPSQCQQDRDDCDNDHQECQQDRNNCDNDNNDSNVNNSNVGGPLRGHPGLS